MADIQISDDGAEFLKWFSGEEFPGTRPSMLRALAEAHGDAADGIDQVIPILITAVNSIADGVVGDSERAFVELMKDYTKDDGYLGIASKYIRRLGLQLDDTANQVDYTQVMIVLTVIQLMVEFAIVLALSWLFPNLIQDFAMRLLVEHLRIAAWLAEIIFAVAMGQVVGVGLQVLMEVIAQAYMRGQGHQVGWNLDRIGQAAEVGAWVGAIGTVLGAAGGAIGTQIARRIRPPRGIASGVDAVDGPGPGPGPGPGLGAKPGSGGAGGVGGAAPVKHTPGTFIGEVVQEGAVEVVGEGTYNLVKGDQWQWSTAPVTFISGALSGIATETGDMAGRGLNARYGGLTGKGPRLLGLGERDQSGEPVELGQLSPTTPAGQPGQPGGPGAGVGPVVGGVEDGPSVVEVPAVGGVGTGGPPAGGVVADPGPAPGAALPRTGSVAGGPEPSDSGRPPVSSSGASVPGQWASGTSAQPSAGSPLSPGGASWTGGPNVVDDVDGPPGSPGLLTGQGNVVEPAAPTAVSAPGGSGLVGEVAGPLTSNALPAVTPTGTGLGAGPGSIGGGAAAAGGAVT
ncbi:hypothetical protein C7C45_32435, partial [Micromonospora arborensis]